MQVCEIKEKCNRLQLFSPFYAFEMPLKIRLKCLILDFATRILRL